MSQVFWNILITGSLYALIAAGFSLTYNVGNFFNMTHGASFLVGAYAGYVALRPLNLGLACAILIAALSAAVFAFIAQTTVVEELVRRRASRLALFIATLGILIVTESFMGIAFGNEIMVFFPGAAESFAVPGGRLTAVQAGIILFSLVLFLSFWLFFHTTDAGRRIRAVTNDSELALVVGISVNKVTRQVVCFSAVIAGITGVLLGLEQNIRPTSGMMIIFSAMTASIIGGVGSFTGPILGAFLLGTMENLAVVFLPSEWKNSVVFLIVIVFFALNPRGIWGE